MGRVLLVEDDEDIRNLVAHRLRGGGHKTLVAGDAEQALQLVDERGAPELLVLDVGLPGMDGFELLSVLRERVSVPDLPAVFLTARVLDADIARGRSMGATYLTKPFVASALLNAVDKALGQRASGDGGW